MTGTSDAAEAKRLLSESELDAVAGGFVIYGAEVRGIIIVASPDAANSRTVNHPARQSR
jgi:hypothetical protein